MKKTLLLLLTSSIISFISNAQTPQVHVVMVGSGKFTPANIDNVMIGDTIRWQWASGSHTTTDTANGTDNILPDGADTWNAAINVDNPVFDYVTKVPGTYNYICIPHVEFGMIGSFTVSGILPVTLTSFAVTNSNNNPSLIWKTASEQNTDYFSVRRSVNGAEFAEIARIPAAGNSSSERSYSFTDTKISSGQQYYYYNVAIVDKDGKRVFSDTRLFKNNLSTLKLITSLSPNPVSGGHLMMSFNADKVGKMNVRVINPEGKTVITTLMDAFPGVNSGHLHLGKLVAGSYSVVCMLNGIKESHQIIVK